VEAVAFAVAAAVAAAASSAAGAAAAAAVGTAVLTALGVTAGTAYASPSPSLGLDDGGASSGDEADTRAAAAAAAAAAAPAAAEVAASAAAADAGHNALWASADCPERAGHLSASRAGYGSSLGCRGHWEDSKGRGRSMFSVVQVLWDLPWWACGTRRGQFPPIEQTCFRVATRIYARRHSHRVTVAQLR